MNTLQSEVNNSEIKIELEVKINKNIVTAFKK